MLLMLPPLGLWLMRLLIGRAEGGKGHLANTVSSLARKQDIRAIEPEKQRPRVAFRSFPRAEPTRHGCHRPAAALGPEDVSRGDARASRAAGAEASWGRGDGPDAVVGTDSGAPSSRWHCSLARVRLACFGFSARFRCHDRVLFGCVVRPILSHLASSTPSSSERLLRVP